VNLCLYEDAAVEGLGPLALLRPSFALRCGIFTLAEKLVRAFPSAPLYLLVRPHLAEWTRHLYPTARVNEAPEGETMFVNGRLCLADDEALHFLAAAQGEGAYAAEGLLVAARVRGERTAHAVRHLAAGDAERAFEDLRYPAEVTAFLARTSGDLVRWNPRQIVQDMKYAIEGGIVRGAVESGATLLKPEAIHVARGARVMAGAVLNAEGGPIWIAGNAMVEPLAYVEGPAAVGEGSRIKALARIREGTSIGPGCKVGGEVEGTIFQGWSNKQHDGFLGHSFVGEWVNLGANTNTSDLKNTYSNVRTYPSARAFLERRGGDSGQLLLGLTVGDFTKSGISVSFTTGATVGIGCNVYGAALMPAYLPSFVWGPVNEFTEHRVEGVLETAARAMQRRKTELGSALEALIRTAFEATREDRALFLAAQAAGRPPGTGL
jgi:UDP-N-acetylglucosamine diphosphorylase/glucosamine-1-phosphate N-acetyltransferase